jgi:hypothetical protein
MNWNKMLKACKDAKKIDVNYYGEQKFLSNGYAAADITLIAPDWEVSDFATSMGLDAEDLEIYSTHNGEKGEREEIDVCELPWVERMRYSLNIEGVTVQPFMLSDGRILWVDMDWLAIFKDESDKRYKFGMQNGAPVLYVCVNGMLIGIIGAVRINLECVGGFTRALSEGITKSYESGFLDSGGQMTLMDD